MAQVFKREVLIKDEGGSLIQIFNDLSANQPSIESVSKKVSSKLQREQTIDSVYFRKMEIPFILFN